MQQHGSKYFSHRPPYPSNPTPQPLTQGMGSIGQNSTFSEHGYVAYQIKWNNEMQQHGSKYFAYRPPHPRGQKGYIQLFLNNVMLHIK